MNLRARPDWSGLLLAGGGSVRMGTDKLRLEREGKTILDGPAAALKATCSDTWIAGRAWPGLQQLADRIPNAGPLSALASGLRLAKQNKLLLVPGDHPDLDPRILSAIQDAFDASLPAEVVVLTSQGQAQPLLSAWSTSLSKAAAAALDSGERSIRRWLTTLNFSSWRPEESGLDSATILRSLRDLDTPSDWQTWRSEISSPEVS